MKILHAYIRMLGAQIGKLPVSVGNGSDRIGTSTCMCFALMNTSPRISEGRVPTISGRAEGQRRGQRD